MRFSLRLMVIGFFVLLALSSCVQGVMTVAITVRSARQVSTLYQHGLVPVVGSQNLSQDIDQERTLLAGDVAHLAPDRLEALYDELASLDTSITASARRVLLPASLPQWQAAWTRYHAARSSYLHAVRHGASGARAVVLHERFVNRLNAVLDVVQHDTGVHLYTGDQLYTTALANDWTALRAVILSLVAVLALGTVVTILVTRRLTRGLSNLVATAQAITRGQSEVRADERGRDEIALLAGAFNLMMDALLSAERRADGERHRIARDLHDSVLQDLVLVLRRLQVMQLQARNQDVALDASMEQEIADLQRAMHDMRTAVYNLRIDEIQNQTPVQALQGVVERNRRAAPGLDIALVEVSGFPSSLSDMVKVELSRLLQEALTNVRRHANARHATVTLGGDGQNVWLDVADDGRGFDPQATGGGMGLAGMRERVQMLEGSLEVQSMAGRGTRLRFVVPLSALRPDNSNLLAHAVLSRPVAREIA